MPQGEIWTWAWNLGAPVVMLVAIISAFYYRKIYTAGAYKEMETSKDKAHADMIIAKDKSFADMVREKNEQIKQADARFDRLWKVTVPAIEVGKAALNRAETVERTRP